MRAGAYQQMGEWEKASNDYMQYLQTNSDDANAATNLAYSLLELDSITLAKKYFVLSQQLDDKSIDNIIGLIEVSFLLNEKDAVTKYKAKMKQVRPDLPLNMSAIATLEQETYFYTEKFKAVLAKAFE